MGLPGAGRGLSRPPRAFLENGRRIKIALDRAAGLVWLREVETITTAGDEPLAREKRPAGSMGLIPFGNYGRHECLACPGAAGASRSSVIRRRDGVDRSGGRLGFACK